jgi:hypothetical protein
MTYNKPSITTLASALCAVQSVFVGQKQIDNGDLSYTPTPAYEVDE